ncbi:hypothetical protein D0469_17595 [Peribacillus saganii]|uniref:Uncharacterized protein n=1 Tax=Peribacillus saganii TaxID=2303992 RepID=A0A372LJ79_9BACI|nr:hypothetical protein [Peribacillus saganii]RFU66442.1 hypothetical protein D0469_17595 [Peribacillus saganii]
MYIALVIMMVAAMFVLFLCGYYVGIIKEKYGKNWLFAVPVTIAILMFNVIWALMEMSKDGRWQ